MKEVLIRLNSWDGPQWVPAVKENPKTVWVQLPGTANHVIIRHKKKHLRDSR